MSRLTEEEVNNYLQKVFDLGGKPMLTEDERKIADSVGEYKDYQALAIFKHRHPDTKLVFDEKKQEITVENKKRRLPINKINEMSEYMTELDVVAEIVLLLESIAEV